MTQDLSVLTVRPARIEDAGEIGAVYAASWLDTYPGLIPAPVLRRVTPERIARRMRGLIGAARPRERVFVAERGDRVIGMASAGDNSDPGLAYDSELFALYVDPAHYGKGAGFGLLTGVLANEAAAGARSLIVWVLAANPARFFYEGQGGRLVAERRLNRWGTDLPALGYAWEDLEIVLG